MPDSPLAIALVVLGALAGGFVNGLTGFGTAMTALPVWLHALPPMLASPLAVVCSIVGQLQTFPQIWHAIDMRRLLPFVVGGLIGVPFGALLLPHVDVAAFKLVVGVLLVLTCGFLLLRPRTTWSGGGRAADGGVGFAGGILGGLAGLSGLPPTLWAELRGWEKDARRAVFQGYNLAILLFALASQGAAGIFTAELGHILLLAVPCTMLGAWAGRRLYGRLDTARFSRLVLVLLMLGGASLMVNA